MKTYTVGTSSHALIKYSIPNWGDITKLLGVFLRTVLAQGGERRSGISRCVRLLKEDDLLCSL